MDAKTAKKLLKNLREPLMQIWAVILMGPALYILALWWIGVFDPTSEFTSPRVIAATVGLGGALLTTSISAIGLGLKHSIDARSLAIQRDAEARLRKETALQAVELMTSETQNDRKDRERSQGALFALQDLGSGPIDFCMSA